MPKRMPRIWLPCWNKIPRMFGEDADAVLRMHDIIMQANPDLKARL